MNAQTNSETIQEVKTEKLETNGEPIYREVEVMASYRRGYDVLLKNIEAATKNCKRGKTKRKTGEVVAEVLVSKIGEALEAKIIKSDADFCDRDIVLTLKRSHQWIPARINNKPVNSYVQITINLQNSYR